MSLTSPIAILWMLLSAGDPAASSEGAAIKATAPAPVIEIVLAGPRESRARLEAALRAVVGSDLALGWSSQESLPEGRLTLDGATEEKPGELAGPRIWVDLRDPAKVHVTLPAAEPQGAVIVRTVRQPEGDAEGGERVAHEEIVQIVKAAVLALRARPRPEAPSLAPIASRVPVSSLSKPPAVMAGESESPVERARPFSFLLGGGLHTQPRGLSNNIGQKDWLGPSLLTAGRWQVRRWQLGLRFTWERSEFYNDRYHVRTDLFSGTVAAGYRFAWRWLSLTLGLQAGVVVLYQDFRLTSGYGIFYDQAGTGSATGPVGGPVLEIDFALSRRIFLHLDAAVPTGFVRIDNGFTRHWDASSYVQSTLGLGVHL